MKYDFREIEPKWQKKWDDEGVFRAGEDHSKPKFYGLVEFPYPSGAGMHVGHIKAYSGLEVDLPQAQNAGLQRAFPDRIRRLRTSDRELRDQDRHRIPRKVTDKNIAKFTSQLKRVGFSFDWSRVIDTTEEDYYKWTQWIFLKDVRRRARVPRRRLSSTTARPVRSSSRTRIARAASATSATATSSRSRRTSGICSITEYADKLLRGT